LVGEAGLTVRLGRLTEARRHQALGRGPERQQIVRQHAIDQQPRGRARHGRRGLDAVATLPRQPEKAGQISSMPTTGVLSAAKVRRPSE
jgi:hypothetical protein